jgi:hypothetical protein
MAKNGEFVWYDLMTTDPKAAESFYTKVIGWTARDSGMPGEAYTLLSAGDTLVGGLMAIPAEARAAGAKPGWMGYISVDDVDAYAKRVTAAGGTVHRAPGDIPGIGRFAVVADPDGAAFILFQPLSAQQQQEPFAMDTPGHIGWHELHAGDGVKAFEFYSGLFGWTKAEAMDMGPLGVYQLFATGGDQPVGGIMTKMADTPKPFWLYYFNVDAIDAAMKRATDNGATVVNGPMEVPGGSWIVQCIDPQGAMFAMLAQKR